MCTVWRCPASPQAQQSGSNTIADDCRTYSFCSGQHLPLPGSKEWRAGAADHPDHGDKRAVRSGDGNLGAASTVHEHPGTTGPTRRDALRAAAVEVQPAATEPARGVPSRAEPATVEHDGSLHVRDSRVSCQAGQDGGDCSWYGPLLLFGAHFRFGGINCFSGSAPYLETMGAKQMKQPALTAREAKLVSCHGCHLLCRTPSPNDSRKAHCPRCGASLHQRKPNSIARTWALVLAAFIFYIPANVLPITIVISLGKAQSDTIMSGVIYFMATGMWPIALIIFIASVVVPLAKLLILSCLLVSVQRRSNWRPHDRTRLYRITEAVGRWSMLDIFVITILVALVKLGGLATIEAGPAAVFFAAVVVTTMFAAMSFDPRLIWDQEDSHDDRT